MGNEQTRFKKGADAREKGRKGGIASGVSKRRYSDVMQYIRDVLETSKDGSETGKSPGEYIVMRMLKEAVEKGDVRAASFLFDRAYGKAPQAVDIQGQVDHTLEVSFCESDEELDEWK